MLRWLLLLTALAACDGHNTGEQAHRLPRGRFLVDVHEATQMPTHIIDHAFVTFTTNVAYVPGVEVA